MQVVVHNMNLINKFVAKVVGTRLTTATYIKKLAIVTIKQVGAIQQSSRGAVKKRVDYVKPSLENQTMDTKTKLNDVLNGPVEMDIKSKMINA